jgi:hypothetical protein
VARSSPPPPSRQEVEDKLLDLLAHRATREQVAEWAEPWIIADDPDVDDEAVWKALTRLVGADLKTSPTNYLHNEQDFEHWLRELVR